jgi:hypothetical protein
MPQNIEGRWHREVRRGVVRQGKAAEGAGKAREGVGQR